MILQNATNQQLIALQNLREPLFEPFLDRLRQELATTLGQMMKADEPARIYRLQGRYSALSEILDSVEKAPEYLKK